MYGIGFFNTPSPGSGCSTVPHTSWSLHIVEGEYHKSTISWEGEDLYFLRSVCLNVGIRTVTLFPGESILRGVRSSFLL